jgi:hypothetical protein
VSVPRVARGASGSRGARWRRLCQIQPSRASRPLVSGVNTLRHRRTRQC